MTTELDLYFRYRCEKGLHERGLDHLPEYVKQLNYEIDVIIKMGFPGYFLIVCDLLEWARSKKIIAGPGRGCLSGDTKVFLDKGKVKNIKDVKVGEKVISHTGDLRNVIKAFEYDVDEALLKVNTYYGDFGGITATSDHRIFAQKAKLNKGWEAASSTVRKNMRRWQHPTDEIFEVPIGDLEVGDWIFTPKPKREIKPLPTGIDFSLYSYICKYNIVVDNDLLIEYVPVSKAFKYSIRDVVRNTGVTGNFLRGLLRYQGDQDSYESHWSKSWSKKKSAQAVEKLKSYVLQEFSSLKEWCSYANERRFVKTSIAKFIPFDDDFLWLVGKWTADGWFKKEGSREWGICFNSNEVDQISRVEDWLTKNSLAYTKRDGYKGKKLVQIRVNSGIFSKWWKILFDKYRCSSQTKHFPSFVFSLPDDKLRIVIKGYMDGDGHYGANKNRATTTSYILAYQLRFLLLSLGLPSSLQYSIREEKRWICLNPIRESYVIDFPKNDGITKYKYRWSPHPDGIWTQIWKIAKVVDKKKVYDISVEKDSSYLTTSGVVHNSVGGSLAAYSLRISHVDPIRYKLIFERFLNPDRVSMCDIDMDYPDDRREEVIEYLVDKFGENSVSRIGTFGTMKAKGAIRDITRCLGYDYEIGDKLSNLVLPPVSGQPQSLETCYEQVAELKQLRDTPGTPEAEVLRWAERLENRIRTSGTHASGVVISEGPVYERIPLMLGKDKKPTTQFEMNNVEEVGLIKFDILGLKALTTVDRCCKLIEQTRGTKIDPLEIPLDDEETFELLSRGETDGIFQLEGSSGLQDLTIRLRPRCLEDISLLVALYRPGPLATGMVDQVIKVRNLEVQAEYYIPELRPILEETAGCIVYQEQAMQIARDLAGYSMGEADTMRKAIGKKKAALMEEQRVKFVSGMVTNGFEEAKAQRLFGEIEGFAAYSFNRSHSLTYGYLGYITAYLKAHYPSEFMCACMTTDSDEPEKVVRYISYCKSHGIEVSPPDVNASRDSFTVDKNGKICFGLAAIKNLGAGPVKLIVRERERGGEFVDIFDFCRRVDNSIVNSKKLESLILCGAFDKVHQGMNRTALLMAMDDVWKYKEEIKRYESKMETYNKRLEAWNQREEERKTGVKKPSLKFPEKPEKPGDPKILEGVPSIPVLEKLKHERELLGFYLSGHPVEFVEKVWHRKICELGDSGQNEVIIIAVPTIIKELTTRRKKERMAQLTVEDNTGSMEVVAFPKSWSKFASTIAEGTPLILDIKMEANDEASDLKRGILVDAKPAPLSTAGPMELVISVDAVPRMINALKDSETNDNKGEMFDIVIKARSGGSLKLSARGKIDHLTLTRRMGG